MQFGHLFIPAGHESLRWRLPHLRRQRQLQQGQPQLLHDVVRRNWMQQRALYLRRRRDLRTGRRLCRREGGVRVLILSSDRRDRLHRMRQGAWLQGCLV
jgi:hypothetical protein